MSAPVRLLAAVTAVSLAAVAGAWNFAPTAAGQPKAAAKVTVYRNFTLHAGTGEKPVPDAVLVVKDGKIEAAGAKADAGQAPDGADEIDLGGAVVIPGLVDTHSHIGLWNRPGGPGNTDVSEMSGPVQPGARAIDAINPDDAGIRMAVSGGVTTANIMPGSGNVIGGQTLYVKLRGRTIEEMRVEGRAVGGLKMANGENPKSANFGRNKSAPATRMKIAALQREQFVKAREY